jgi:hypothetical protein
MSIFAAIKTEITSLLDDLEGKIASVEEKAKADEVALINEAISLLQAKLATLTQNQVAASSQV